MYTEDCHLAGPGPAQHVLQLLHARLHLLARHVAAQDGARRTFLLDQSYFLVLCKIWILKKIYPHYLQFEIFEIIDSLFLILHDLRCHIELDALRLIRKY